MTKVRLGINLLWMLPGMAGGAEQYAIRVLEALRGASDELDITLLCNRRTPISHPHLSDVFPTAVAPVDGGSRVARIVAESTWLPREATRRRFDLVHHMNNVLPWIRSRPSVVTMHDLRPIEMPETMGSAHGAYLRSRFGPSARHAAAITTPTAFVRNTVIELLGADPDRVVVVGAPLLRGIGLAGDADPAGIAGRFFLYPAMTHPHKDHRTLLEAFAEVVAARPGTRLVLTGVAGQAEDDVIATIARLSLTRSVDRLGLVPERRLAGLFRDAVGLVYPSRYEGFGLPLAEAMAIGCPVIAANATALPEVVGGAGVLVEPGDVHGWTDAMLSLLDDESRRISLIAAGHDRARSLTPEETARRSITAYRLALT